MLDLYRIEYYEIHVIIMDYSRLWRIFVYIAIAIIQCLSYSQTQADDQCRQYCWNAVQPNSHVYGGKEQVGVANEEECKELCVNNGTCIGVDWNTHGNSCWFQMDPATVSNQEYINHWSLADCTDDCVSYCWRPLRNNSGVGGGQTHSEIKDENHCKLLCSNTSNCTGIDWDTSCYLIFTKGQPSELTEVHHWDIERKSTRDCLTSTITTAAATTSIIMTTSLPHVTTTAHLETTTHTQTRETSTSEFSNSMDINSGTTTTESATSDAYVDKNAAIIGGVVGGFCGLILLIILLVIIIRLARKRRDKEKIKLKEVDDDILMEPDHKKNGSRPAVPPKPEITSTLKPSTDFVSLTKLSSHFASLNSVEKLKREFDSLPLANYDACSAAKSCDNSTKRDRFKNILPYDATRVKLLVQKSGTSDYVNASYIEGYDGSHKVYIAAQGPLKTTLSDFWQMIWNEGLNRIVMITHLTEQGKSKCEKYWPDDINGSKEFNEVTVTLVERHICTDYVKRVMRVEHKECSKTRLVTQLHFTIWNDKGIPTEVYPLLAFRRRVRLLDEEATGPMLVHCSAGVGRTGTFIALDCLLEQAEKTKQVSVFGVVKKLREQRMVMVQVADQYKLLYQAVLEANKTGVTDVDGRSFKETFPTANINRNLPESLITSSEFEFKLLEDVKKLNSAVNEQSAGHQQGNLDKNRSRHTIPDDKVRIHLSPTSRQSDYINAVLTQGHRCPGHYILTQLPLKETIGDFWRMVAEHNCPTIVVLQPPDETDELVYWPLEVNSILQFGKISVQLSSKVTSGEILGLELHLKRSGFPSQIIQLYRLSSWGGAAELPDSATDVLNLIRIVSDRHQQLMNPNDDDAVEGGRKPVIVVCPDGATKSGLFVAASYLIDKMNSDRSVDAYLSSRYVISSRPQAITSLAQYRYLLRLAAEHLHWTPTVTIDFPVAQVADEIYVNANQSSSDTRETKVVSIYANS